MFRLSAAPAVPGASAIRVPVSVFSSDTVRQYLAAWDLDGESVDTWAGATSIRGGAPRRRPALRRLGGGPRLRGPADTALAWRRQLADAGLDAEVTSDWRLDEFGRGDIALRVPQAQWVDADELLGEPD